MGDSVRQCGPDSVTQHRFLSIHFLHSLQSGLPPVPARTFSFSMLLPALQLVQTWCTPALIECHGNFLISDFRVLGDPITPPHSLSAGALLIKSFGPTQCVGELPPSKEREHDLRFDEALLP